MFHNLLSFLGNFSFKLRPHEIKLEVVSEGVETQEQLEILRHMGCDTYQGFLPEKPMPQHEFEKRFLGLPRAEGTQNLHAKRVASR